MLISKSYHDIPSKLSPNGHPNRIFVISPVVPGYPKARFPGVVVFRVSEIYQVTGPVERFAGQIASAGRSSDNTPACPSSFHEFEPSEPIPYDVEGQCISDSGFVYMLTDELEKEVAAYDEVILDPIVLF
ncbi:11279_t:CDS:2, partial [Acaulospora colombiana]